MSDDDKAESGKKTVPDAHTPTPLPQWVIEHARRVTEEALFNPPMPPEYRERYERLNREATETRRPEGEDAT